MPSLHLLTTSAQLRLRLLATRLLSGTDLRTCDPNAGKTLRERGEPLAAISSFNNSSILATTT
jgi:hypothetical protein